MNTEVVTYPTYPPEYRRVGGQVVGFDEGTGEFEAVAVTYNITDSYRTRFLPGCFNASLRRELPPIVWGHNDQRELGLIRDWKDQADRLVVIGQLTQPSKVTPEQASFIQRAWKGLTSGVLTDFSVALWREKTRKASDGILEFEQCRMSHLGLVLEGAVPGAVLLATRDAAGTGSLVRPRRSNGHRLAAAYRAAGLDPSRTSELAAVEAMADDALASVSRRLGATF